MKKALLLVTFLHFVVSTDLQAINGGGSLETETVHSVLWIGTSIPEGCHYPEKSCSALGMKCYNVSLGASGICLNSGFMNNARDGKDLAESRAEKIARYKSYEGNGIMTTEYYDNMLTWGYDERVIPYLDGTKANCDIAVIDHGFNDRNGSNMNESETIQRLYETFDKQDLNLNKEDNEFDRSNFVEAFCFLIKKIREANPSVAIVICSHIENTSGSPEFDDWLGYRGYYICLLQKKLADHFGFPFLNVCGYNDFSMEVMPNSSGYLDSLNERYGTSFSRIVFNTAQETSGEGLITYFQYHCPDGVHPHTDQTGQSEQILTHNVTEELKVKVLPYLSKVSDILIGDKEDNCKMYDMSGRVLQVSDMNSFHGILIKNGQKILAK